MNGRADVVGPTIELGDFLPERRQVSLNGNTYNAWVTTNRRYPRLVMTRLDRAARKFNRKTDILRTPLAEGEEPSEDRIVALEEYGDNWNEYVTEAILALVPGTTESELDLVDLDTLYRLGQELGYFPPDPNPETAGEVTEAAAPDVPLTGDSSPESSVDSTPATELTSS